MDGEELIRVAFEYAEQIDATSRQHMSLYTNAEFTEEICIMARDKSVAQFLFFFMEMLFEGQRYEWPINYLLECLSKDGDLYSSHDELDAALAFKIWSARYPKLSAYDIDSVVKFDGTGYTASQLEIWTFPRIKACLVNIF
jgi:hypothetical protein